MAKKLRQMKYKGYAVKLDSETVQYENNIQIVFSALPYIPAKYAHIYSADKLGHLQYINVRSITAN